MVRCGLRLPMGRLEGQQEGKDGGGGSRINARKRPSKLENKTQPKQKKR